MANTSTNESITYRLVILISAGSSSRSGQENSRAILEWSPIVSERLLADLAQPTRADLVTVKVQSCTDDPFRDLIGCLLASEQLFVSVVVAQQITLLTDELGGGRAQGDEVV